ncbi:MAG: ABC transporter ATP-binding protein [Prevotellaceae bacterium]|jgi:iron complex transport system ATP-binding protein|nr:ABC transporter ATP-binding protein [Prevotellaceae bacterium]
MTLELKNVTLGYPKKTVLKHVCMELHTGQTICVLGKNGSGKTTLFKSILGILPLLSGEILLNGKSVCRWSRRKFARLVAYVPQARSLPFPFTALDVALFGRTAHLSAFALPARKDRLIAEECMEKLRIDHLKNRIFTQLSGGEQQMVIVARALAQQPAFLVMDEPTSSLDFGNQIKIIRQVNELKSESLGVLMATHSPDHAYMCGADVAVVHGGELRSCGHSSRVITEKMLRDVYGVDVRILTISGGGGEDGRKICMPIIA